MTEQVRRAAQRIGLSSGDEDLSERTTGRLTGRYTALWTVLLFGWVLSYADRTLTGPVIAWVIPTKAGFIGDASNPAALGGLVGSMFFAGTCSPSIRVDGSA